MSGQKIAVLVTWLLFGLCALGLAGDSLLATIGRIGFWALAVAHLVEFVVMRSVFERSDGSMGHHGLVTDLIRPVLEESAAAAPPAKWQIVCCGPQRMMEAAARIAADLDLPCHVSLETPMACGIGICFSCVAKIRDASGKWDYRRTCVEGPVFDAKMVEF